MSISNGIRAVFTVGMVALLANSGWAQQGTTGFWEQFALASNRAEVIAELIPGSEDYYFFKCLERQHANDLEEVDRLLATWIDRHGRNGRTDEMEIRQALLKAGKSPSDSYDFLIRRLGLRFDHQPPSRQADSTLPSQLDPQLISREVLARQALAAHPGSLNGFDERALPSLLATNLPDGLLAVLLNRLDRPDLPNLPAAIIRELETKTSRGFGSLKIHNLLLLDQLEECARLKPELLHQDAFLAIMIPRLIPSAERNWDRDPKLLEAYLERLQALCARLPNSQNSLKAHVLYHRLALDLRVGAVNKERFLQYLRLPRNVSYASPEFLRRISRPEALVDCNRSFATELPAIRDDEPLVRSVFVELFQKEDSYQPYTEWINENYLSRLFAEVKILYGQGDQERWYALLNNPSAFEALSERVEIAFAPQNKMRFGANEAVTLDLDIKNVKTLLVKVHEVHALNYYRDKGREIDATLEIDGLMAREEKSYSYDHPPLRRVRHSFTFDSLARPGVYVIDFLGNGMSSRAVIYKGSLRAIERVTAAGHQFRIHDDDGQAVVPASMHFGGREYTSNEEGVILIPFGTQAATKTAVLMGASCVSLHRFRHQAEGYELRLQAHMDRESMLRGNTASILLSAEVLVNGSPAALSLLEKPILTVTSTDVFGLTSELEVRDLKLALDEEWIQQIRIPEGTIEVAVSLRAQVQNLSEDRKQDLRSGRVAFPINHMNQEVGTRMSLLAKTPAGYVLSVLGKNGEPVGRHPVTLTLRHREFSSPVVTTLQTAEDGSVRLGALTDITSLATSVGPDYDRTWNLELDGRTYPRIIHAAAGEDIRIPFMGSASQLSRADISLIEMRGRRFARDAFGNVSLEGGFFVLKGLPPGDYDLYLKGASQAISVFVTEGPTRNGFVFGQDRWTERQSGRLLHITSMAVDGSDLVIQCANTSAATRIHLFRNHYVANRTPLQALSGFQIPTPQALEFERMENQYASGRRIADEYRYILERRYAKKYAGNMLDRPGLILNPFEAEDADQSNRLGGGAGGAFGGRRGGGRNLRAAGGGGRPGPGPSGPLADAYASLDFLDHPALVTANLRPDASGLLRLPLSKLGTGTLIFALAIDEGQTVGRSLVVPSEAVKKRDLRLTQGLDSKKSFAEQKGIEFVNAGATATLPEDATSQTFDSLDDVFRLYQTLGGGEALARFAFLLEWPERNAAEKLALYSEHACHELHFFLQRKDPAFFEEVVRPYLQNKITKTFLDDWLLDQDLGRYRSTAAFARLNILERILLLRRLNDAPGAARHVGELTEQSIITILGRTLLLDRSLSANRLAPKPAASPAPAPAQDARARRAMEVEEKLKETDAEDEAVEDHNEEERAKNAQAPAERKSDLGGGGGGRLVEPQKEALDKDAQLRGLVAGFYRAPRATQRLAEHNYFRRSHDDQGATLVSANRFWKDFAQHAAGAPFLSINFPEASGNVNEMLLALAVLDLPFRSGEHTTQSDGRTVTLKAASRMLLLRREVREAKKEAQEGLLLVRQTYRSLLSGANGKSVPSLPEYIVGEPYECSVIITNPTEEALPISLLEQIPAGTLPVNTGREVGAAAIQVPAFGTVTHNFSFYFPEEGTFEQYPVQAARDGVVLAAGSVTTMKVVRTPTLFDPKSFVHVADRGTDEQVFDHLANANLQKLELGRLAWRAQDKAFFARVLDFLRKRHTFDATLWSYALKHRDAPAAKEYLEQASGLMSNVGPYLESPLLSHDPVIEHSYQHLDYAPLFNQRAHQFGKVHHIANSDVSRQFQDLMEILAYHQALSDADWMSVAYYFMLQDRVESALLAFSRVDPAKLASRLQYDYFHAYLDFYREDFESARAIATRHQNHPVTRWSALFKNVLSQLDEAEGKATAGQGELDATARQAALASKAPAIDFLVEARRITIQHENVTSAEIALYEMDVEFLFSSSPFVDKDRGSFAYVVPNHLMTVAFKEGERTTSIDLPQAYQSSNLLIEVRSGGLVKRSTYHANTLSVSIMETMGQVKVVHAETTKPLPRVYIKVFARDPGGKVRFHKDGYTDLRGRFDYASVSGSDLQSAERYAILVLSESNGSLIRELAAPMR